MSEHILREIQDELKKENIKKARAQADNKFLINEVEDNVKKNYASLRLKHSDFSKSLPDSLARTVAKYVNLKDIFRIGTDGNEIDDGEKNDDDDPEPAEPKELVKRPFNESTLTEVLDKELGHKYINLHIEPPPVPRKVFKTYNWTSTFLKLPRKARVVWPTKIYHFETKFINKTLYDQAEQLTDLAVEEFTGWINSLSKDQSSNLSKDFIKTLFSIGIEGDASKALYVEPKRKAIVPHEVAEALNMPELSIERNVARLMKSDRKDSKIIKEKNHAFGSSLPQSLKQAKHTHGTEVVQPVFPDELRRFKVAFAQIHHLGATKSLARFLMENPELPKPKYLIQKGLFKPAVTEKANEDYIPLYEYFITKQ